MDPDDFFITATKLIHETGYVTGLSDEYTYWNILREKTGIAESDEDLREEILGRFTLRPSMVGYAEQLKSSGYVVGILSDQTNWLDEIDEKTPFFYHFDYVFNSFRLKKSKRDPSVFRDVCGMMGLKPHEVLFVDDNDDNLKRASAEGLMTILFVSMADFERKIAKLF